ncbi:hypothetical protein GIB67_041707 [Kingdonia uniflora]|uniref:lipoyl(octanoyl) transferase n=1 Tax=Kingdonia uniflora TaxID=39325 RepID=A0A7J7MQU4_9MAGN|nr:hypothetical protein GIB67_041707 [Kingdonia uniflora]
MKLGFPSPHGLETKAFTIGHVMRESIKAQGGMVRTKGGKVNNLRCREDKHPVRINEASIQSFFDVGPASSFVIPGGGMPIKAQVDDPRLSSNFFGKGASSYLKRLPPIFYKTPTLISVPLLVMYPIMNLGYHKMCSHLYMRTLEEVVIQVLSITFSIEASRREGLTGVWFGDQKLAAIGIRVASKWVTFQGLALNVTTDLTPFEYMVPCGIPDHQVGSIQRILENSKSSGETINAGQLIEDACKSLLREFSEVFQLDLS